MVEFHALILAIIASTMIIEQVLAGITVQIGGASRLGSPVKPRERYRCFWNCELVGCQLTRDDDECSYDCDKVCKLRFDYSGRSDSSSTLNIEGSQESEESILKPKSAEDVDFQSNNDIAEATSGHLVRLRLPRNATANNFGVWERCSQDSSNGKLVEHSFNL